MAVSLTPYLHFGTEARAVLEFYRSVFGGEPEVATFASFGMSTDPADADLVMHGFLRTDAGLEIMASDTPSHMTRPAGTSVSLSLSGFGVDDETLRGYWTKLREGAREVGAELAPSPWGASFGQLTDRFGVIWLVNIDPGEPQG
ncbi:MAG: VOC family protein [Actinobacteria bacterium]|nr:VOC family protein [Actinomycetota bacterium]MCG2800703.1 VOC family protein [Cellulomonas sp.]